MPGPVEERPVTPARTPFADVALPEALVRVMATDSVAEPPKLLSAMLVEENGLIVLPVSTTCGTGDDKPVMVGGATVWIVVVADEMVCPVTTSVNSRKVLVEPMIEVENVRERRYA